MGTAVADGVGALALRVQAAPGEAASYQWVDAQDPSAASPSALVTFTDHGLRAPLTAPASLVDGQRVTVRVTVSSAVDAVPAAGARVTLQARVAGTTTWQDTARATADAGGKVSFRVRPRRTVHYRTVTADAQWWRSHTSASTRVQNLPPGKPVVLPAAAPEPRSPKTQPRADKAGADAVVSRIPDEVWKAMKGRSWRRGCLARSKLRLVRVNHYGFDGYRYRGEVVVAASVARCTADVLTALHAAEVPIRSMVLVDRFGYSERLGGADNYASMAADNTSAFNCRDVVGRPGVRSPHATGRAIDINPLENPYLSRDGWLPHTYWVGRSHPRVAWRSSRHKVVRIMARHGFRWTYGVSDGHHFDG